MVVMASTVEVGQTVTSSASSILTCRGSISNSSEVSQGRSHKVHLGFSLSSHDNSSQVHPWSADLLSSQKPAIPEASPAFRETMGKMRSERKQGLVNDTENGNEDKGACVLISSSSSPSSPSSSGSSLLNKFISAFRSTSSTPAQNSCNTSRSSLSSTSKAANSRRPASFGGADVVKPWTGRRASQHEKRVSWADESGSDQALFAVKLIKPRLSVDKKSTRQTSTPVHSILRNTGLH